MALKLTQISKSFPADGGSRRVLDRLDLCVEDGEFVAVLGQSGCGKSTLLRIAGGFEPSDSGSVLLGNTPVVSPSRKMIMLFQDFNQLFPWMTLQQNLLFALRKTAPNIGKEQALQLARACLEQTGLGDSAGCYPYQLSGGMKQRGALARALALSPKVLLMDEPFSSLDYLTRRNAQDTLKKLWSQGGLTVLFITHDIGEVLLLAQRIAVFDLPSRRIGHIFPNDGTVPDLKARLEELLRVE